VHDVEHCWQHLLVRAHNLWLQVQRKLADGEGGGAAHAWGQGQEWWRRW
jgi:hypothetical protein